METWYDQKAMERAFIQGEKSVSVVSFTSEPRRSKFCGPYTVNKKASEVDYIVYTPDSGKKQENVSMWAYWRDIMAVTIPQTELSQNIVIGALCMCFVICIFG